MIKIQFILFGVITFAYGKQIREYDDPEPNRSDSGLEKILQELFKQGKLDVKKHHHETHSDHMAHHDLHHGLHHDHEANPSLTNIQTLNLIYKKRPNQKHRGLKNTPRTVDTPLNTVAQADNNRCGEDADDGWGCEEEKDNCDAGRCGKHRSSNDRESVDEVADLLDELEQEMGHGTIQVIGGDDLRCGGNRCGRGRNDRDDNDNENDDKGEGGKDDLRCRGNRCGRGRADVDRQTDDVLRCRGNRCGRGRADDSNRDAADNLRCRGNRCGRGRSDRADSPDDGLDEDKNDLRCRGNRCGRGRDGKDDNDRDGLRCRGNRCGRGRSGKELKCLGSNCGSDSSQEDDVEVIDELDKRVKKYKISDDLDALVLNIGDLDHLLTKLGKPTPKNLKDINVLENIDLDSLLGNKRGSEEKRDVEAIVIDMSNSQTDDNIASQIKNLLSQNNDKTYTDNRATENQQISNLFSQNQQRLLEVNKLIGKHDNKEQKASKILPHREENNNVYVPKWLHNAVLTNSKLRQQNNYNKQPDKVQSNVQPPSPLKSMFPLTIKQKSKMLEALKMNKQTPVWRRNVEKNVGVPFELQVQGLGQVKT